MQHREHSSKVRQLVGVLACCQLASAHAMAAPGAAECDVGALADSQANRGRTLRATATTEPPPEFRGYSRAVTLSEHAAARRSPKEVRYLDNAGGWPLKYLKIDVPRHAGLSLLQMRGGGRTLEVRVDQPNASEGAQTFWVPLLELEMEPCVAIEGFRQDGKPASITGVRGMTTLESSRGKAQLWQELSSAEGSFRAEAAFSWLGSRGVQWLLKDWARLPELAQQRALRALPSTTLRQEPGLRLLSLAAMSADPRVRDGAFKKLGRLRQSARPALQRIVLEESQGRHRAFHLMTQVAPADALAVFLEEPAGSFWRGDVLSLFEAKTTCSSALQQLPTLAPSRAVTVLELCAARVSEGDVAGGKSRLNPPHALDPSQRWAHLWRRAETVPLRWRLLRIARSFCEEEPVKAVLGAATGSSIWMEREAAYTALSCSQKNLPWLRRALDDSYPRVRATAWHLIGNQAASATYRQGLRDVWWFVRVAAVRALPAGVAGSELARSIRDPSPSVRAASFQRAAELQLPILTPDALRSLDARDEPVDVQLAALVYARCVNAKEVGPAALRRMGASARSRTPGAGSVLRAAAATVHALGHMQDEELMRRLHNEQVPTPMAHRIVQEAKRVPRCPTSGPPSPISAR